MPPIRQSDGLVPWRACDYRGSHKRDACATRAARLNRTFSAWPLRASNFWGDAPGSPRRIHPVADCDEIAPLALTRYKNPLRARALTLSSGFQTGWAHRRAGLCSGGGATSWDHRAVTIRPREGSKISEFFSRRPQPKPIKRQKNGDSARQMPSFACSKIFSKK
jgi:hypothetical protein